MNNRYKKKNLGAKASNVQAAMDALARLLMARERSVQEAHKRLAEKGYEEQTILQTLERAQACELLDDQRFARGFMRDKISAGWGKRRIEQELYRFGIATEDIDGYPDAYFADGEQLERALIILRRHHSQSKNPRQAAYRFLVSKGYSSDIASAAIRTVEAEKTQDLSDAGCISD